MTMIRRGDVFYANLNGEGSIQGGKRPVIVISNDMNNRYSPTLHIIPCTAKRKKRNLPVHVYLEHENFFTIPTMALAEQLIVINNTSLAEKIGSLSNQSLRTVEKAIQIQLGLNDGEHKSSPYHFYIRILTK